MTKFKANVICANSLPSLVYAEICFKMLNSILRVQNYKKDVSNQDMLRTWKPIDFNLKPALLYKIILHSRWQTWSD